MQGQFSEQVIFQGSSSRLHFPDDYLRTCLAFLQPDLNLYFSLILCGVMAVDLLEFRKKNEIKKNGGHKTAVGVCVAGKGRNSVFFIPGLIKSRPVAEK